MNITDILILGVCAGVYSLAMATNFNSPKRSLVICFAGGFLGIVIRDMCNNYAGYSLQLSSFISATVITIGALFVSKQQKIAYVTIVSATLPLGAALPFFRMVNGLMKIPGTQKNALGGVIDATIQDAADVFTIYVAVIWGTLAAVAIYGIFNKRTSNPVRT